MRALGSEIEDVLLLLPEVHRDDRGWFAESHSDRSLQEIGISVRFVQDNHSFSAKKGTLRGLHYQIYPYAQAKLIRCTRGAIMDVVLDLRPESATYGKWTKLMLSAENMRMLFVPRGLAHGFVTLKANTEVQYKVDDFYDKECERSIRYDDPDLCIDWGAPIKHISEKDMSADPYQDRCHDFEG
ncbi:MAG: dTDP-4-dehydrorhamnose 3,5-epimerase [Methanomassiliicoccales archaeon PtaU1.Bin124]|nr:MAG: dTDP-4-dehydrorhamnose 3,5-epimerase [Methanomassiliicoccales archaeon PtaU1.Bin124]